MKKSLGILVLVSIVCFFVGCASAPEKPNWTLKGGGVFKDKKILYGVGLTEGIKSEALRRTTADNRAIAEISKQLSTISSSLMRDYMSSTSATEGDKTSGEQYIENTVKTFTSNTLSGVKITDRWDDGKTTYSLATLDIDEFKSLIGQVKEVNQQVKDYIKVNAEKAFDKLEAEQSKQK